MIEICHFWPYNKKKLDSLKINDFSLDQLETWGLRAEDVIAEIVYLGKKKKKLRKSVREKNVIINALILTNASY